MGEGKLSFGIERTAALVIFALAVLRALSPAAYSRAREDGAPPAVAKIKGTISCGQLDIVSCAEMATISARVAAAVAKERCPGKVLSVAEEIEDKFLVYAVSIDSREGGLREVLVDAGNAHVLSVEARR